jgi:sulfate permease, SulP family
MPWLAVMLGVIFLIGAFVHVAELVQYISRSVMIGYLSGAALLIMANQMKDVLDVSLVGPGESAPRTFFSTVGRLAENWAEVNPASLGVAVGTLLIYAVLSRWRPRWPNFALAMVMATVLTVGTGLFQPEVAALPRLGAYLPSDLHPKLPVPTANLLDDPRGLVRPRLRPRLHRFAGNLGHGQGHGGTERGQGESRSGCLWPRHGQPRQRLRRRFARFGVAHAHGPRS